MNCPLCMKLYRTKQGLEYHIKHNVCCKNSNSAYKCNSCNTNFTTKSNLNRHMKTNFVCKSTEPSKSLKNSEKLSKNHSKSLKNVVMTSKSLKKYCCKYCNKSYTRIDNLHRHINKFCKHKIDQINKLEKQIKDLQNNQTYNTTIINQVHNNNTYIKINSFGDEDTSSISDQDMYKIVDRCYSALKTLAKRTYITIPENRNIYLPGYKDN